MRPVAVTVRPATEADAAALATLSGELGYATTARQLAGRLTYILASKEHAVFAAQIEAGEVVGWVHVYRSFALEAEPRAEIVGLVIASAQRRRGIGRLLVASAERWARDQGLTMLGVRANTKRADAHAFYESIGFTKAKAQFNFRKSLA